MITVCILNYNDYQTTNKLVQELLPYASVDHIVVVDNNSSDDSYFQLRKIESGKVKILRSEKNGGYGYGNNYGILYAQKEYKSKVICVCNPDVSVSEKALNKCCRFVREHNKCIIAAPLMVNKNGEKQRDCAWPIQSGVRYLMFSLKILGKYFNDIYPDLLEGNTPYKVDCVAGSCLIIDVEKFKEIGMYDENVFLYCEETLIGIKAKLKGYESYILRDEIFQHLHSVSINKTIDNVVKQKQLMWNSRRYLLKNYYNWGEAKMLFAGVVSKLSLLEDKMMYKWR